MNRRDLFRSTVGAAMLAVSARLGLADVVDPCADLPWTMWRKTLTREEMTAMFGPMPSDVTIDLVPCINCGGEGGHTERLGPIDRAVALTYPCARCFNPGRLWGESWVKSINNPINPRPD